MFKNTKEAFLNCNMVNEMTMLAARASGGVWTGSKKTKLIQDFSQDGRNNLIIELKQF